MSEPPGAAGAAPTLQQLLARGAIWQGARQTARAAKQPTGLAWLDQLLEGGWPQAGLVELLHSGPGQGEVELILPLLGRHSRQGMPIFMVTPPGQPCAPGWQQSGVALEQLWFLLPRSAADSLWALEQLAAHPQPLLAVGWASEAAFAQLRRLQLAAEQAQKLLFLLRDDHQAAQPSPARLRLAVARDEQGRIQPQLLRHRAGQGGHNPWRRAG
ncbi:MAG: translesion DNA synthesis-associated protein ImuA [Halothiobacillaceae bacterium]